MVPGSYVSDLVNANYGLTPDEIALIWQTAHELDRLLDELRPHHPGLRSLRRGPG